MPKSVDNPQFRSQRARLRAYTSWANTENRAARTLPGRRAMLDKFEKEVDPEGKRFHRRYGEELTSWRMIADHTDVGSSSYS
jgi:hypothetical protein